MLPYASILEVTGHTATDRKGQGSLRDNFYILMVWCASGKMRSWNAGL